MTILLSSILWLVSLGASASVELPSVFGDGMVLQRNTQAAFWGKSEPDAKVVLLASWRDDAIEVQANSEGRWQAKMPTPEAGGPYTISINDVVLKDILIGEVWICSGQSNMWWPMTRTDNAKAAIAEASFENIRLFQVKQKFADTPQEDVVGEWQKCSPATAESFSAVSYYFGRKLHRELNMPIGLIHTSWGGSTAEAWTSKETLEETPSLRIYLDLFEKKLALKDEKRNKRNHRSPASLYNGMLYPLIPFTFQGAIWYQGESNVGKASLYKTLFSTMIDNWRQDFRMGDFPFYFVQLAPYNYGLSLGGAALRDAQRKTLSVANTGMAVILDIGNPYDIHPTNKLDVGERLAMWALARTYGRDIVHSGPLYVHHRVENSSILLHFDHVGDGLSAGKNGLIGFEIAGPDRLFYSAKAVIEGTAVRVSSPKVSDPRAVRYAFTNISEAGLLNWNGLPASSFRTDSWPLVGRQPEVVSHFDDLKKQFAVVLKGDESTREIRYSLDSSLPDGSSLAFQDTLRFASPTTLKSRLYQGRTPSSIVNTMQFVPHVATGKSVKLVKPDGAEISGKGLDRLTDGIISSRSVYGKKWHAVKADPLAVVIDLGERTAVENVEISFLQDAVRQRFLPRSLQVEVSDDGHKFKAVGASKHALSVDKKEPFRHQLKVQFKKKKVRYLRITAENIGTCPPGHPRAGSPAWVVADEVVVK